MTGKLRLGDVFSVSSVTAVPQPLASGGGAGVLEEQSEEVLSPHAWEGQALCSQNSFVWFAAFISDVVTGDKHSTQLIHSLTYQKISCCWESKWLNFKGREIQILFFFFLKRN